MKTGKSHLSYSEIKSWVDCAWRHKLTHVEKLGKNEKNIFSDFGGIIHETLEVYLQHRTMDVAGALSKIEAVWLERNYPNNAGWPTYPAAVPNLQYWLDTATSMLEAAPVFLEAKFPGWQFVSAEEQLYIDIDGLPVQFKGYVDAIIKTKRKNGKEVFHILDWKTAGPQGWNFRKVRDPTVLMQLVLYKHFWAKKNNLSTKDVKCGFILLKRLEPDVKKRKKAEKIKMVPGFISVSAGPKSTERSLKIIRNMVNALDKSLFLKNKFMCLFCEFYNTEHCKLNL